MSKMLSGGCLCGAVQFELESSFKTFYQCHCKQCRHLTGTAFASNLFTAPDNIEWLNGINEISKYEHPDRSFSKAFCKSCGSALPFINKSGSALIVPAGSLNEEIDERPRANIFFAERACWLDDGKEAEQKPGFP